ncbi:MULTISPECIES: threonine-phosphate decarboxylase CobD [unclassified Thioalkalivibrio]|uniref:threonine-phosphate decarboxylase CobD n=1 Tax=unclassified Thioalkalivibrio TaxID=2621013 RepID=UPI0003717244|nr:MULTISPECIES: threonine-phosphate decarboxylase CobD [unclassified Thioalkalivibrio]
MSGPLEQVHGGGVRAAAAHYGIPEAQWLDLSTGINPQGYPVGPVPAEVWQCLPEDEDGLEAAARAYYGAESLLPVAGSQAAIQALPRLRAGPARVGVLEPSYNEHTRAWRAAGHEVVAVSQDELAGTATTLDVLVLVNPNNPTAVYFDPETLLDWHCTLAARGGWLVVDEAFMDTTPEQSLAGYTPREGLFVLRSLGKFFGLAGARVGFVLAPGLWLERVDSLLGPWSVPGPARWVARQALEDRAWQTQTRWQLQEAGHRLDALLREAGLPPTGGTPLFRWCRTERAQVIQDALARQGILVRRFDRPASLRFGLPGSDAEWQRLEAGLQQA